MPKISLAYTSRRAQAIEQVVDLWRSRAGKVEVEIVLCVDADYAAGVEIGPRLLSSGKVDKFVVNPGPFNCVAGWNKAAEETTGDIIISLADDFSPPENWAESLVNIGGDWWLHDRVVWVADGYNTDILTLTIWSRRRYQRFGYLFYPSYYSLFSDTENTYVANLDRVIIDARNLLFEHMHPDCGKRDRDDTDLIHASSDRWRHGEMIFNYRKSVGFPIDAGPMAHVYDPEKKLDYALYVQAIKDDIALYDVCARIIEEGKFTPNVSVSKVYLCIPTEYWSGRKTSDAEKAQVLAVGDRINAAFGPSVKAFVVHVAVEPHRVPGRSRIDVETFVRNDSINGIRQHSGCEHILIADGDELWRRGLLAKLSDLVREAGPHSVFTGMVPVVGLPGYAVDQAVDKASIYIHGDTFFTDCRGASRFRHELVSYDVIHFTATRPTMEEIIKKHRESGHFDDPEYSFEQWINEVLPNINEKSKNLHMWKMDTVSSNIWPKTRHWTASEWKEIPDSLKQYLVKPKDFAQEPSP
jgi:hypothetical protein